MALASSRLLRRASWNLVDQALSATSNLVLAVVVARCVSAEAFGAFAIAFLTFGIAVAVTKSVVGQPLQMRFSGHPPDGQRVATVQALGCALLLGLTGTALLIPVGLVTGGTVGPALLGLAAVLPALLLQDSCRMAMFTRGAPRQAALIDLVWVLVQFTLVLIVLTRDDSGVVSLILAWGGGAAASAVVGLAVLRAWPAPRATRVWMSQHLDLTRYLSAEYLLGLGTMQLALVLVGVIASATDVGSLRAAQVLLGPLGIAGTALFQFAVPEIARATGMAAGRRRRFAAVLSAALATLTVLWGALLLVLPDPAGVALFGESWSGARSVLLPMVVSALASSCANGPGSVLYGMGLARVTYRIHLTKGPVLLVAVLASTWLWGAAGAAWALAAVEVVVLPAWILTLIHLTRTNPRTEAGPEQQIPIDTLSVPGPDTREEQEMVGDHV